MNGQNQQSVSPQLRTIEQDAYRNRDFYTYEAQALAIAPAGAITDTIAIEADSSFMWQKATFEADIAGAAQLESTRIIPLVTIQLTDTGSGRQLMQNPIPITSLFGIGGGLPFILPIPRMFMRNSTIQVAFVNFSVAVTYNVRLAFIGYKHYSDN